jgi:DNA-binding protein YbaB
VNYKPDWKILLFFTSLVVALLLTGNDKALADDYSCTGTVGAITVDNLRVPQNATCTLEGTQVEGNIFVESNATLYAYNVDVDGNIQAENAAVVNVYPGSSVSGSIQIVQSGAADIQGVDINSDLYFDDNDLFLNAANNTIGGNLQAFQNTGGVSINGNTIGGNLQCKENVPPPTGGGNIVEGSTEDQCADFDSDPIPTPSPTPVPNPTPSPTPDPSDDYYVCASTVGAITVDNLRVPENAQCILNGTQVEGNIVVETRGWLFAYTVQVDGNIQAENAARVNVYPGSFVGGSIQIVQSGAADIHGVDINSDLYLDDNDLFLNLAYNTIGGNLQAFQNTGGVSIISNTIDGNLQCKENVPAPVGGGNIVQGNMEDQCANLDGDPPPVPAPVAPINASVDLPFKSFLPLAVR